MTGVFALLFLISLIAGSILVAIIALAAAIWTGMEASGRGAVARHDAQQT
jgi:hypothetical protein